MTIQFRFRTCIYIVTTVVVLSAITVLCHLTGIAAAFDHFYSINYFDLLLGQIANTLIVLSLTSVLSSNFGQAYWVDIKESKLITPFWGCFVGITVYLLTALIFSLVSYALGVYAGLVVSAVVATILLIVLTFKMISIYFGKEELKKQLRVEYRHMLVLNNAPYVSDYLRRLKSFLEEVDRMEFLGKGRYIRKIKKEIQTIETGLDTNDERTVSFTHKKHIENHFNCMEKVKSFDSKIVEYTQNAINSNDSEIVRENIDLLVGCENYKTFLSLLEELFDWDEEYTCRILREVDKQNGARVIGEKISFFKKYALNKLITQSGKLDAIQYFLRIYDTSNLGMSELQSETKHIRERCIELVKLRTENNKTISEANIEEIRKAAAIDRKYRREYEQLKNELLDILQNASTKDFRMYYFPIREACAAYDEGKYEVVNKYVTVMIDNYRQETAFITAMSGINEIDSPMEFSFSYVTDDEKIMINQLIEKDKSNHYISEKDKALLSKMDSVTIKNNS